MVSFTGLVHWMIDHVGDDTPRTLAQLLAMEDLFTTRTIGHVVREGPADQRLFKPFCAVEEERGTLYDAMVLLGKRRLHSVCVVNRAGALVNIITQGRVIQFLHDSMELLGAFTERTISDLGLATKSVVISISWRKNMWDALRLLRESVSE